MAVSVLYNFKFNAFCVRVLIGLLRSSVLFTLPSPTLLALIPAAILLFVTTPSAIIGAFAEPAKSPANFRIPFVFIVASGITIPLLDATIFEFNTSLTLSIYFLNVIVFA